MVLSQGVAVGLCGMVTASVKGIYVPVSLLPFLQRTRQLSSIQAFHLSATEDGKCVRR